MLSDEDIERAVPREQARFAQSVRIVGRDAASERVFGANGPFGLLSIPASTFDRALAVGDGVELNRAGDRDVAEIFSSGRSSGLER